jgi:hypothetical protein
VSFASGTGHGRAHANGTRVLAKPGDHTKAEAGRGLPGGSLRGQEAPDFDGGGALCVPATVDPDQFHPSGTAAADEWKAEQTIATYCAPCPMRDVCLAWGRKVGRHKGIWGGVWFDAPQSFRKAAAS